MSDSNTTPKLEVLRTEIDSIDEKLVEILVRRFALTEEVGRYKAALGREIKDEAREGRVLEKVSSSLADNNHREFIVSIFKALMNESVHQQDKLRRSLN